MKYREETLFYQEPEVVVDSVSSFVSDCKTSKFKLSRVLFITGGILVFLVSAMLAMHVVKTPVYGDSSPESVKIREVHMDSCDTTR